MRTNVRIKVSRIRGHVSGVAVRGDGELICAVHGETMQEAMEKILRWLAFEKKEARA